MVKVHGGKPAIDAVRRGLEAVVEGPLFQESIPRSWHRQSVEDGKLAICARSCGIEYDSLGKQRS